MQNAPKDTALYRLRRKDGKEIMNAISNYSYSNNFFNGREYYIKTMKHVEFQSRLNTGNEEGLYVWHRKMRW